MFQSNKIREAEKAKDPEFIDKEFTCKCCGGSVKITKKTTLRTTDDDKIYARCPYCHTQIGLNVDPHKHFRARLERFIKSQVEPIKNIENEDVRLPMKKLLDDFYKCVLED